MSRCFPFPPPGYDKKIPFDAEQWLKKEKQEKKHKKEKRDRKDKEKKDKKEKKRDKEKSDKKDKKRKHKKDKERSEDEQREKKDSTEVKDSDKHRETQVHNTSVKNDKHREIERNQRSAENDMVGPVKYNSLKNIGSNCEQTKDAGEFNFLLGSEKTIRDEIKVKESPLVQKTNLTGRRNPEESVTLLKDKRDTDRKVYGQGIEFVARSQSSCSLPSNIGGDERKVAWVPGLADKRTTEQKENGLHKNVDGKKDGHKDPNREEKSKPKGAVGEDRANVKVPDAQQLKTKENNRNAVSFHNGKPSLLPKAENKTSNLGKRKALEMNDVLLHEKECQPNKLPRLRPPSNHVSEGGRNSEPCTTPSQPNSKFAEKVQNHNVTSKFTYNGSKLEATQANIQLVSERQENRDSHDMNNNILPSNSIVQNGTGALNLCYASKQFASEQLQISNGHNMGDKISLCHPVLISSGSKLEATKANIQLVSERQENRDSHDTNNNMLPSHSIVQNGTGALNLCYASKQFASEQLQISNGHNMDDKISLCHPVLRIGKVVDEAVSHLSSGGDVMNDVQKLNHNDLKINGVEEGKKPNVSSPRPSSKKVKKNGGFSAKPPHSDSMYLSQILNIPSVEWPDMDNQEWLFSGSEKRQSKPTASFSQVAESKHVWSKALRIESADIIALPYVIPY